MANDKEEEVHEVVIVGAGIAGLATAVALRKMGVPSLVLEKAPELRTTGSSITLAPNAWRALEALGLAHKLLSVYQPFQTLRQTNIEDGVIQELQLIRGTIGVHRKFLLEVLADKLPPGTIRFSTKIISIKTQALGEEARSSYTHQAATLLSLDDGTVLKAKVLIGCDGVHSVVAQWLGLDPPIQSGRSAIRGLSVFPEGHGLKNDVQQFIGHGMRAGIVPLNDTQVYWFLVHFTNMTREKELAREPEQILKQVTDNLCKDFPEKYLDVVRHSDTSSLTWTPLLFRVPWNVILGRTREGCVTVAGDAMHPMTPDLGQGGCTALEDAVVLARNIGRARAASSRIEAGIESYIKERKWRAAEIITKAYLFGWVQQAGGGEDAGWWSKWVFKWFRNNVLYRFLVDYLRSVSKYDCGTLI